MGKALTILLLVALAGLALQVTNHVVVHGKLCSVAGVDCGSVFAPARVAGRWQGPESLPSAVRGVVVDFAAATALLRKNCGGRWIAGFGARIEVAPFAAGDSFRSDAGACVDAARSALSGEFVGARLKSKQCTLGLAPLRFEWNDALKVDAATTLDAASSTSCAQRVSSSSGAAKALRGARLELTANYAVPFATLGEAQRTEGAAKPVLSGGWLRSALGRIATDHTLTFAGSQGNLSLRLASVPPPAGARSPEFTLEMTVDERLRKALPTVRPYVGDTGAVRMRWNMDHEKGHVTVNGARIERGPRRFRPAGLSEPKAGECEAAETAKLLFVESDDDGKGNEDQLNAVFEAVESAASRQVVVTVFVHGWQHSAAPGDGYVCSFAALIRAVEMMERQRAHASGGRPRAVLGVYVGWPGALYPDDVPNLVTTFWNRLEVANQIGAEGAVLPRLIQGLVQRLPAREHDAGRSSALLVVGHSLGARAVFHAVRPDVITHTGSKLPDLVLLVNPAFSADLYRQVHEQRCTPGTSLLLFSSETDGVTRQVYPAGQALSYRYAAESRTSFLEYVYTAANFGEFVTHQLRMDPGVDVPPSPNGEQTILRGFQRVPSGTKLYSDTEVMVYHQPASGRPRATDLWYTMRLTPHGTAIPCASSGAKVVEVDTRILPNHGDIFTPPFMEYVVRALNAALGR